MGQTTGRAAARSGRTTAHGTAPARSAGLPISVGRVGKVAVITVSYNTRDLTARCVESVLKSEHDDVTMIVVDNDSSDGSAQHLRERFPDITVIESGGNLGFAKGCNLGASEADADYLLFLNPDAIIKPEAIGVIARFADAHPDHGLYGGLVVDSSGEPDPSAARPLPSTWSMVCFGTGASYVAKGNRYLDPDAMSDWDRASVRSCGMLSGAMLLVRRDVWDELAGFDPDYFMYAEDADLCFRARERGYDPVCVPAAKAVHDSGAASTSDNKAFMKMRGQATYLRKNWSGAKQRFGLGLLLLGVRLRALSGRQGEQSIDWRALWGRRAEWYPGYP